MQKDSWRIWIACGADTQGGRRDIGPAAGLGTQGREAVDVGLWIHFHYVSITTRTLTYTLTSDPRTAKSISESVTNVTCKNHWPTDVSGKPSDCLDFKTANTQNLTFNIQTQSVRGTQPCAHRGQSTQNAPSGAQKKHWQPFQGSSYHHTEEYEGTPRGRKKKNVSASEITEPLKAFTPSSHETFKPEIFAENYTWSFNVQLSLFQDKLLLQQIWWGHWIFQYSLKIERFQKSDRVCIIRNLFKITWAHQS